MSQLIRTIGNCYVNGYGFDIFENENGTATIRGTKPGGVTLPRKTWLTFDSLNQLEQFLSKLNREGNCQNAARLVQSVKKAYF